MTGRGGVVRCHDCRAVLISGLPAGFVHSSHLPALITREWRCHALGCPAGALKDIHRSWAKRPRRKANA